MRKSEFLDKSSELKERLETDIYYLNSFDDFKADIKLSMYRISDGLTCSIDGEKPGWAASIIKVPIMMATINEIVNEKLSFDTKLLIDHKFLLEEYDYTSRQPQGTRISVIESLYHMIVESDNEATNLLVDKIGLNNVNEYMWRNGLDKTMLGHLLCYDVPRHTSEFNPDGSNITCPDDMVNMMRHIYDTSHSKIGLVERLYADTILSKTRPLYLQMNNKITAKAKMGYISDNKNGQDMHEVAIFDNDLILCVMINKLKRDYSKNNLQKRRYSPNVFKTITNTIEKYA